MLDIVAVALNVVAVEQVSVVVVSSAVEDARDVSVLVLCVVVVVVVVVLNVAVVVVVAVDFVDP